MNKPGSKNTFLKVTGLSIICLFVLILAGGVVRGTGSGMGCPDWPKCFGCYIPPTTISQLPGDYKQKYVAARVKKNERFAKTLDGLGYTDLAKRLRQDRSVLIPEEFNAARTWTEYINRLIGVVSGFLLLASAIYSIGYWKINKWIPVLSVFNLLLIGFQGWLGSIVVSTNLTSWVITVHLLLALAILALSITTWHMARIQGKYKISANVALRLVTFIAVLVSLIQITFGTDVREKVDAIATRLQDSSRGDWVTDVGSIFFRHREASLVVLAINILLYVLIRRSFGKHSIHQQLMSFTFVLLLLQMVTGILLSYLSLPPVAQVAHVLLASLIFGAQFYLLLNLYNTANKQEVLV